MSLYKKGIILEYIKNKEVLDLGSTTNKGDMFDLIKRLAKNVIGVDLQKSDDPQIIEGNVENINLNKKFDVIIAGDIIEHLDNTGLFLDNMYCHLKDNGLLLITTPNAKSLAYLFFKGNPQHTCWYCQHTLRQALERHKFKIEKINLCVQKKKNVIYDFLRYLFANNLVVICKKTN